MDDAGAGVKFGGFFFDEGGADADNEFAFVEVVEPTEGAGVESALGGFEFG